MSWNDFNDAEEQNSVDLIPNKTPVKVRLKIRAGGFDDPSQGWTGGFATRSDSSGSVYIDPEYTIIGGKYNKRKVWGSLIGLHSSKGPKWASMGRAFIRAALESARGIAPSDASDRAIKARQINGLGDLDGLEFAAFVEVQKAEEGSQYGDKNIIQNVIPCTHKDYAAVMSGVGSVTPTQTAAATHIAHQAAADASVPAWAR